MEIIREEITFRKIHCAMLNQPGVVIYDIVKVKEKFEGYQGSLRCKNDFFCS